MPANVPIIFRTAYMMAFTERELYIVGLYRSIALSLVFMGATAIINYFNAPISITLLSAAVSAFSILLTLYYIKSILKMPIKFKKQLSNKIR